MSARRYDDGDILKHYTERLNREYNYTVEFLPTDQTRTVLKSRRYFQSVRDLNAFTYIR